MRLVIHLAACVTALGVARHEWIYHQSHDYRPGVSGILTVLALTVAAIAAASAWREWEKVEEHREERRTKDAEHRHFVMSSLHDEFGIDTDALWGLSTQELWQLLGEYRAAAEAAEAAEEEGSGDAS